MDNLTINQDRLTTEIDKLATISDAPAPAVTRILFTKTELAGRAYIRQLAREAGLTIREDAVGNLFFRWEGSNADLPAVATGSHIDAIPFSGKYDGTIGVIGAIEAIRALTTAGFHPVRPIEIIMFTAEEPTRFGLGCLGSRALCGQLTPDDLEALKDKEGQPFDRVRQEAGYTAPLDTVKLEKDHYKAFVELHIEQGPILERLNLPIGIVTSIAAPATLRLKLTGDGGHAGAVLMPNRRDALLAAAEITLAVEQTARETPSDDAVATTGLLTVHPGAVNSIPSAVTMEIDIRDTKLESRDGMVERIQQAAEAICTNRKITLACEILNADPPITCGGTVIAATTRATETLRLRHQKLVSRAYHDALFMGQICPSGMIFIPSQNGYSHRPEEYSSPQEITHGVRVLAHTLANLASQ